MKIGMVTACYKPVINGVTRMVALYKQVLTDLGHDVTVFTLGPPDPAGDEPGVVRSPGVPLGDTGYHFALRYTREAQERLRQMEIVHCHHLFMSVEMAHRYADCPIVYTNHTRYDLYTGAYTPLSQPAADLVMKQVWPEFAGSCDVVVAPSAGVAQVMRDFGVAQPIEVIPNGVELGPFQAAEPVDLGLDGTVAVYVGRVSAEKSLDILLDQFAVAHDIVPTLRLAIVGDGPARADLTRRARELGIAGAVRFVGKVPFDAVPGYLAAADIFATASTSEVHPLTVIEAMASGLPVVAVASPGISETVTHGATGLLTQRADGGLAAGLAALAFNPPRRAELGHAARSASARYDIHATVRQTLALYDRLLAERPDKKRRQRHGRWFRTGQ